MFGNMKARIAIRKNLWMNKLALLLLRKALVFYREQSKPLVKSLNSDAAWISGIENEERHLDTTQRIVERRLHSAINKTTSKQRQ